MTSPRRATAAPKRLQRGREWATNDEAGEARRWFRRQLQAEEFLDALRRRAC